MNKHLLLIDSSGFAYRAFYGGSKWPRYRERDGAPTGTVLSFLEMLWRLLGAASADPVSHAAAVFDPPGKTFRHEIFHAYKANRQERDPELSLQLPTMRHAAAALGLLPVEALGFEADDVIATLARQGVEAGLRVTIVSSDKDMGQLVRDGHVEIVDPLANKRVLEKHVVEKFGVPPRLVPDVQALAGDAVDNIPGVDGMGHDTAARLIRKLGSLEGVIAEAAKASGYRLTAGQRHAIRRNSPADLRLFLRLTTLVDTVGGLPSLEALEARPIVKAHLDELLRALEAGERFSRRFTDDAWKETRESAPILDGDPLDWHAKALVEYGKKQNSSVYKITLGVPDIPQVGWYKRRLIRGGPWVPARIWRERAIDFQTDKPGDLDDLLCQVGDKLKNPSDQWPWLHNAPISEADYDFMRRARTWAKNYAPNEPEANEDKPIDWNQVPL